MLWTRIYLILAVPQHNLRGFLFFILFLVFLSYFCQKWLLKMFVRHCKLTRRRMSNSIYITVTTLWPRAFLCLILRTSVGKANLFSYILWIQTMFVFLNIFSFFLFFQCMCVFYFSLTWRAIYLPVVRQIKKSRIFR